MEITSGRIRELIEEQSIPQKRLADELQVSYSTMNNYLCARRWLNLNLLRKLSRFLHTSSDYLLGLSDIKNPYDLPDDEQALLEIFRALPAPAKRFLLQQMRLLEQLCRLLDR